jgi:hypothetical protein
MASTSSISELWISVFFIIGTQYSLFCIEYFNFLCDMGEKARGWLFGDVIRGYARADFRVDKAGSPC